MSADRRGREDQARDAAAQVVTAWALGRPILSAQVWPSDAGDEAGLRAAAYSSRVDLEPRKPDARIDAVFGLAPAALDHFLAGTDWSPELRQEWHEDRLADAEAIIERHHADIEKIARMLVDAEPERVSGERLQVALGAKPSPLPQR